MLEADVIKVAKIMLTADGWCINCQDGLLAQLEKAFPEHAASIHAVKADKEAIKQRFRDAEDMWIDTDSDNKGNQPQVWDIS
jgi:hypothetical protein